LPGPLLGPFFLRQKCVQPKLPRKKGNGRLYGEDKKKAEKISRQKDEDCGETRVTKKLAVRDKRKENKQRKDSREN